MRTRAFFYLLFTFAPIVLNGCVVVPQNQRGRLADPMMSIRDDATDGYRKQKLYTSREGAAGGDGAGAGGGCSCQ